MTWYTDTPGERKAQEIRAAVRVRMVAQWKEAAA